MSSKAETFPNLIHIRRELDGDTSYLVASEYGVVDMDSDGEPVAVYKLVDVGRVSITKAFVSIRKANR